MTYSIYDCVEQKYLHSGLTLREAYDWLVAYDVNDTCCMYPDDGIYVSDDDDEDEYNA